MKKFTYGSFKIFDYNEMSKYFLEGVESGAQRELSEVIPSHVEFSEIDLLKLKIELLREGYELELIEQNNGDTLIADKAYSHYLLTITPKLEEFFKLLAQEENKDEKSDAQVEKYRQIISNITEKVKKAYGDFNIKNDLHKEKLNRYKRSIDENKDLLNVITKKCEEDIKEFDKKLKLIDVSDSEPEAAQQ